MKRIRLCLAAILLLFVSCEKSCIKNRPKGVKSIDWKNYNDVHTVFWNYYSTCGDVKYEDKEIMVSGWLYGNAGDFLVLTEDTDYTPYALPHIIIRSDYETLNKNELYTKLTTSDLGKKCFVKGKLSYEEIPMGFCCMANPSILISDTNDIYFE